MNTYLNLCTQVYDLSKPAPPAEEYAFYKSYVSRAKGAILEPMCGTGRFLLPLLEEGFNVEGFDASQHMLNALQAKAKMRNLNPKVSLCFIEDFKKSNRYSLIFIPSGSFCLISDPIAALKSFYELLEKGGILVFEVEEEAAPTGLWRGSAWPKADGSMIIASFLDLPIQEGVATTLCKYELVEGSKVTSTEIEDFKLHLYQPEELKAMIKTAGFKKPLTPRKNVYECRK